MNNLKLLVKLFSKFQKNVKPNVFDNRKYQYSSGLIYMLLKIKLLKKLLKSPSFEIKKFQSHDT